MVNTIRKYWFLMVIALFCFSSSALADTVSVTFEGAGGPSLGGVYVYPYVLKVTPNIPNPNSPYIYGICDDWADEISTGQPWTATVYTLAQLADFSNGDLALTKWGSSLPSYASDPSAWSATLQDYEAAAWLATQEHLCPSTGNCSADYNYAIWQIFDPSAQPIQSRLSGTDETNARALYNEALGKTYTPGEFPNYDILTPTSGGPQEFIFDPFITTTNTPGGFSTPEAQTSVLLGFGGLGLLALIAVFRRGEIRTAQ